MKRVLIIASGRTEQLALPHLLAHLSAEGITVEVRTPDRNRKLLPSTVASIIYDSLYDFTEETPDKYAGPFQSLRKVRILGSGGGWE